MPPPFFPSLAELLVSTARGIAYFGLLAGRTIAQIVIDILRAYPRANPLDAQSVVARVREAMQAAEEAEGLPQGEVIPIEDIPASPLLQDPRPGTATPQFEYTVAVEYVSPDGVTRYITERIYGGEELTTAEVRDIARERFFEFVVEHPDSVPGGTSQEVVLQDVHIQQIWRRG